MKLTVDRELRIGFIFQQSTWLGGLNYFRNLLTAIRSLPDGKLVPVVLVGTRSDVENQFPRLEIIKTPLLDRRSPSWIARKVISRTTSGDILLKSFLRKHNIQAISHSGHLGGQSEIATVGWIPDFQHVHLPNLFDTSEIQMRDVGIMDICKQCTKVIVSSNSALADLQKFSPDHAHKADVLQFVAGQVPHDSRPSLAELQRLYHFDTPFFLLPNQFWAHKNHSIVIEALRELRVHTPKILVLVTGPTKDDRNPTFFSSLMQYARQCEVLEAFKVLGPIPFAHLNGLMQHAIALINPSKFEGWSTTVEESKSMGKRILLSDIPVHREQAPPLGSFFNWDAPRQLAELLVTTYDSYDPAIDDRNQELATLQLPERQCQFARVYERIVENAVRSIAR